jgi:predicted DNA-binding transcriptional regulator AlpA
MNSGKQTEPLLIRAAEGARQCSMSRPAFYRALRKGLIPGILIAGQWRVPQEAIDGFVAQAMRRPDEVEAPSQAQESRIE